MRREAGELRARLQRQTGVDFATYADDDLVDAVTGWSGLLGLVADLGLSVAAGLVVVAGAVTLAWTSGASFEAGAGIVIGGLAAGAGLAAAVFGVRARRRAPTEVGRVFDVAGAMAARVADDAAEGRLEVSPADAARGLTMVAAIPALTRAARRRFPLVGIVAAPVAGALLTRILARVWPSGDGHPAGSGLEGGVRRLEQTLTSVRSTTLPRITTAVRWATLPLLVAGALLIIVGLVVAAIGVAAV